MRVSLSQIVLIAAAVLVFCATVALRMRIQSAGDPSVPERVTRAQPTENPSANPITRPNEPSAPTAAAATAVPRAPIPPPSMAPGGPPLPELPATVVVSAAPAGGYYAVLANQSAEPLLVRLTIANRKGEHKYTTELTVPAYSEAQLDGITAMSGDRVTLASSGYRDQVTLFN
jgi:hypothetical protein